MITSNLFGTIAAAYNEGFEHGKQSVTETKRTLTIPKTVTRKKRAGRPKGSKNKTETHKELN